MKRVDNFGSIKDIESYISQLILESNNELDTKVIESKIQNSFSLTKKEATTIYSNLIKNLTDAVHDEVDAEKINIISLVRKILRNHKEHITFQMYQIGDNLNINFSHVQNETELVFLNNFLNLIIKEFLTKKKYTQSKVETKIEAQEKMMPFLKNKLIFKMIYLKILSMITIYFLIIVIIAIIVVTVMEKKIARKIEMKLAIKTKHLILPDKMKMLILCLVFH